MQNSKLIHSLKALTKEELKRFHDFMQSPFFKKSANAKALFEWIYQHGDHPTYVSTQLDNEVIAQHLFSDKRSLKLKVKSVSVAASEAIVLFRQFLVQLEVEKEENRNAYLLMRGLEERRMEKDFWRVYRKFAPKFEASKETMDLYYEKYLVEELLCNFYPVDRQLIRERKKLKIDIYDALHSFEVYTILNKLQYCCVNWSHANIVEEEKNKVLANELITTIRSQGLQQITLVNCYYLILLLMMNPSIESYFYQLKELLKNDGKGIERSVLQNCYTMASNYCYQKIREGSIHFQREVFDLYVLMLEQRLAYEGEYLQKRFIKNMVTAGLKIGETKWIQHFIDDIQKNTVPQIRKSVYAFNKGLWHFYHKEYDKALPLFLQVGNIDVFYNLDCRGLLLKCYYELEETDALFSLADAFRKFVKQQKIASSQKKSYLNFISQTMKLYKIKLDPNKSMDAAIKQSLLETQPINNQQWLLEKAEEI